MYSITQAYINKYMIANQWRDFDTYLVSISMSIDANKIKDNLIFLAALK
jgi:hypothetical protein